MKNSSEPANPESGKLEFPDWRGMKDSSQKIDSATAFRLIEETYCLLPNKAYWLEERWAQKCQVEFVL